MTSFGALSDIRVLDLTQMLAGPYATMLLADHGADVVKIEPPSGDTTRSVGPYRDDDTEKLLGGYFQSINRNKRSICLDLKSPEGRDILRELIKKADVLVENFRIGVMDRLGLSYEELRELNPRLVYAAIRGFGDERTGASPYSEWPSYDVVAQAMGGMMAITGPDPRSPTKVGPGVGDTIPALMLSFGILAAVHHARRTGEGQFLDVAMVDSVLALCERTIYQHSLQGLVPAPEGNHHPFIAPFGIFMAADGAVTLAAPQQPFYEALCKKVGAEELLTDPRFTTNDDRARNRAAMIDALNAYTSRYTKAELSALLGGVIPFGAVMNIGDITQDPHFTAREMIVPVEQPGGEPIEIAGVPIKLAATPGGVHRRAPMLGEDSFTYLREIGFDDARIRALIEKGVVSVSAYRQDEKCPAPSAS
jgi:crotonobetainyl-CoA:carnitine CoA-transferase CaiB-like acyl-CoA transferase